MSLWRRLFPATEPTAAPDGSGVVYAPQADGEPDPGEVVWFREVSVRPFLR